MKQLLVFLIIFSVFSLKDDFLTEITKTSFDTIIKEQQNCDYILIIDADEFANAETSVEIIDEFGNIVLQLPIGSIESGVTNTFPFSTPTPSPYLTVTIHDSWGDGMQAATCGFGSIDGTFSLVDPFGNHLFGPEYFEGCDCANCGIVNETHTFPANCTPIIPGCTDPNAINYEPMATIDDGSCIYSSCNITVQTFDIFHGSNDTTGLYSDTTGYYVEILVENDGIAGSWITTGGTGSYGSPQIVGPFSGDSNTIDFEINDDMGCSYDYFNTVPCGAKKKEECVGVAFIRSYNLKSGVTVILNGISKDCICDGGSCRFRTFELNIVQETSQGNMSFKLMLPHGMPMVTKKFKNVNFFLERVGLNKVRIIVEGYKATIHTTCQKTDNCDDNQRQSIPLNDYSEIIGTEIICTDGTGFLTLTDEILNNEDYSTFEWYDASGALIGTGESIYPANAGNYYVLFDGGQNGQTCEFEVTEVAPPPPPQIIDVTLCSLEPIPDLVLIQDSSFTYNLYDADSTTIALQVPHLDMNQYIQQLGLNVAGTHQIYISQNNELGCESDWTLTALTILPPSDCNTPCDYELYITSVDINSNPSGLFDIISYVGVYDASLLDEIELDLNINEVSFIKKVIDIQTLVSCPATEPCNLVPCQEKWTFMDGTSETYQGFCEDVGTQCNCFILVPVVFQDVPLIDWDKISFLISGTDSLNECNPYDNTTDVYFSANACPDEIYITDEIYGSHQAATLLASDGTVPNGQTVELKAGQIVVLEQGFTVEQQAEISISIENCPVEFNPFCGEMHNQVMDAAYQSLIFAVENNLTEEEILDISYQTTLNTLAELSGNAPSAIESTWGELGLPTYFPRFGEDSTLIEDLYVATMAELDDLQLKNDLENLVLMIDEAENYEQFSNYLFNLEQAYQGTTNQDFIMEIVDIATHSYQYWENNIDNWTLFGTAIFKNPNTVKSVIRSDVIGGLIGGVRGAAAGPQGALIGVCISAPLTSSLTGIAIALGW